MKNKSNNDYKMIVGLLVTGLIVGGAGIYFYQKHQDSATKKALQGKT